MSGRMEELVVRRADPDAEPTRLAVVAVLSLGLALTLAVATGGVSLVSLLTPGGLGPSAEVIAADFGADAVREDLTGYDGQQTYAIARSFPDLDAASESLDAPAYRLLRILAPALASVAPAGHGTVITLLVINVLGFGLAVRGGAILLRHVGGRLALALPAAAILLVGVATTTDGPLTWGLTICAAACAVQSRHRAAIALLVLAALSRESAALAALCIGAGSWLRGLPLRWAASYAVPGLVAVTWYAVLTTVVDSGLPTRFDPLGFLALDEPGTIGVAAVTAAIGAFGAFRWRDRPEVALCGLAFTAWMLVYTPAILDPLALLRVNALPIVLGLLALGRPRSVDHVSVT